jgi:hypothetical protein
MIGNLLPAHPEMRGQALLGLRGAAQLLGRVTGGSADSDFCAGAAMEQSLPPTSPTVQTREEVALWLFLVRTWKTKYAAHSEGICHYQRRYVPGRRSL